MLKESIGFGEIMIFIIIIETVHIIQNILQGSVIFRYGCGIYSLKNLLLILSIFECPVGSVNFFLASALNISVA